MDKSNHLRNVHHSEFLVSDGECKVHNSNFKIQKFTGDCHYAIGNCDGYWPGI